MSFSVSKEFGDPAGNRRTMAEDLGLFVERLVVPGLIHGNFVQLVSELHQGRGALGPETVLPGVDGMITETPGLPLFLTAADCPAVFLFDPERPAVGLIHSGWRGTLKQIVPEAVAQMRTAFRTRPENLWAGISPAIQACCYEVGEEFEAMLGPTNRGFLTPSDRSGKWKLDLMAWLKKQMFDEGLKEEKIETAGHCTCCQKDVFFSHRGQRGKAGRMGAMVALRAKL